MARRTLLVTHTLYSRMCLHKVMDVGKKKEKERITFFLSVSLELPDAIRGGENTCSGTQVTDDVASGIIFVCLNRFVLKKFAATS